MYERLLDKTNEPTIDEVRQYLGEDSFNRLLLLEEYLK